MEKKKSNIKTHQLKIDFDVVDKFIFKPSTETKIISIHNKESIGYLNTIIKEKIFKDIINNSKSH